MRKSIILLKSIINSLWVRTHVSFFYVGIVYFGFDFFENITHKDFNGHGAMDF